jgi:hypothetical protein
VRRLVRLSQEVDKEEGGRVSVYGVVHRSLTNVSVRSLQAVALTAAECKVLKRDLRFGW